MSLLLCRSCLDGGVDGEGEDEAGGVVEDDVDDVEEEEDVRIMGYGLGDRLPATTACEPWELSSMAPALTSTPNRGATGLLQIFSHHSSNIR